MELQDHTVLRSYHLDALNCIICIALGHINEKVYLGILCLSGKGGRQMLSVCCNWHCIVTGACMCFDRHCTIADTALQQVLQLQ